MTLLDGSLAEQLGQRLRDQILSGERTPGSRLPIGQVAAEFEVSVIPVRDAIRILEAEGLLERSRTNRVLVAEASVERLHALYELRRWVELPAARGAAEKLTPQDRVVLSEAWERLDALTGPGEWPAEAWEAHENFHRALVKPARNEYAERTLDLVYTHIERYRRLFERYMGTAGIRATHADHLRLYEACLAGKGEELSELLEHHLDRVEIIMASALSSPPHGSEAETSTSES